MRFAKDVLSVISVLRPRNPFLPQNGPDLVTLHTREVMPSAMRRHAAMRTTEARISMMPSLVTV